METKNSIKLLIFDYDGTIIERNEEHILSKSLYNLKNGKEIAHYIIKKSESIKDIKETFKEAFSHFNLDINEERLIQYCAAYIHEYENGIIKESVKKLLQELSRKYTLVILTSGSKSPKIKELEKNKILNFFKDIITSKEAGFSKPDPRAYEYILKKYNFSPKETIAIGNSISNDILPAKKVGIKTVWLSPTKLDKVINALEELDETLISKL